MVIGPGHAFDVSRFLFYFILRRRIYVGLTAHIHHSKLLALILDRLNIGTINLAVAKLMGSFTIYLDT